MTQYEYLTLVKANREVDEKNAREWLKDVTRFQLMKKGVGQNSIPIKHITTNTSVIDGSDCIENIIHGSKLILDCYPTFEEFLQHNKIQSNEIKDILTDIIKQNEDKKQKKIKPEEIKNQLKKLSINNPYSILSSNNQKEIGNLVEEIENLLKNLKGYLEETGQINDIVYKTNSSEFRIILEELYKIKKEDLPDRYPDSEFPNEDLAYLGLYRHIGEILIYLDVIYDNAISLGLNPYLLYRKVLIHELAHAYHHKGFDAKDQIWDQFGYRESTRVYIIEGLAQWYTMHYMIKLDSKEKNYNNDNLMTIIWMSLFQPSQYRHYLNWSSYSYENVRRVIVEARAMTGSLTKSIDFDNELNSNHSKNV